MSILNGLKQDYDDEAKKLRAERKPVHMNPFVFRGHKIGHHLVGLERVWLRVREASGLDSTAKKGEVRLHDFRRTYHTVCMELGYPGGVGDYLLGHSLGKIRDTYTNLSAEGILAQAAIEISGWIGAAMAGREPVTGKKVSHAQA
jgi:integrase